MNLKNGINPNEKHNPLTHYVRVYEKDKTIDYPIHEDGIALMRTMLRGEKIKSEHLGETNQKGEFDNGN